MEGDEDDRQSQEYIKKFSDFVGKSCGQDVRSMLLARDPTVHYGLPVDVAGLLDRFPELGALLLRHPDEMLPLFDEAIYCAQRDVLGSEPKLAPAEPKIHCHARLYDVPSIPEHVKPTVSSIRCTDVKKLIRISGTVIRTGMVKMLESEREYECAKCGHRFRVFSDLEQNSMINLPKRCPARGGGGGGGGGGKRSGSRCKSSRFVYVEGSHTCRDYQEIKIQELVQKLTVGSIPRSIMVVCHDDLVESCQAGDDIDITGVVRNMWNPVSPDERCELEIFIEANHIAVNNDTKTKVKIDDELKAEFEDFWISRQDTPLGARDAIVSGICPQLYGLYMVKLAVALTMIGGVAKIDPSGTKIRGENHLLIVGDPGTGKSQLLRAAAKLTPRSVLTTGIGTTSAGLTVAAVKDKGGDWALEAGALVLADGGICCIDEFGCVREHDRATIHEAMEQQTLSVAKAGLVCTLNTRTTVFAVMNPKGAYDPAADLSVNCAIASPLLSRFDIILVMLDSQNEEWDAKVARHIMDQQPQLAAAATTQQSSVTQHPSATQQPSATQRPTSTTTTQATGADEKRGGPWNVEKMQAYVHYVKTTFRPRLSRFSEKILVKYYQEQRKTDYRNAARTTIRLLESLIRLAQAHARLMFRDTVFPQDAMAAIVLVEASIQSAGVAGGGVSLLHMDFVADPDVFFRKQQRAILQKLNLGAVPRRQRFYSYYAHIRHGAQGVAASDQNAELSLSNQSEPSGISFSGFTPSPPLTQQVLVRNSAGAVWCDLDECLAVGDGTYDVKVADTPSAKRLGIAGSTCTGIQADFVRKKPNCRGSDDGNAQPDTKDAGLVNDKCQGDTDSRGSMAGTQQERRTNSAQTRVAENPSPPPEKKHKPVATEDQRDASPVREDETHDGLDDISALDELDVNLSGDVGTAPGSKRKRPSSPLHFT